MPDNGKIVLTNTLKKGLQQQNLKTLGQTESWETKHRFELFWF